MCEFLTEKYTCCGAEKSRWLPCFDGRKNDCPDFRARRVAYTKTYVVDWKCCSEECCRNQLAKSATIKHLEAIEEMLGVKPGEKPSKKNWIQFVGTSVTETKSERQRRKDKEARDLQEWQAARNAADDEYAKHNVCKPKFIN